MRGCGRLPCEYDTAMPARAKRVLPAARDIEMADAAASGPRAKRTRNRCAFSALRSRRGSLRSWRLRGRLLPACRPRPAALGGQARHDDLFDLAALHLGDA